MGVKIQNKQTAKKYKCSQCGHEKMDTTNHYGSTWSFGRFNTCPSCPPYKKYSEFGGQTIWECQDKPDENESI